MAPKMAVSFNRRARELIGPRPVLPLPPVAADTYFHDCLAHGFVFDHD
jgi:hypothetical protein